MRREAILASLYQCAMHPGAEEQGQDALGTERISPTPSTFTLLPRVNHDFSVAHDPGQMRPAICGISGGMPVPSKAGLWYNPAGGPGYPGATRVLENLGGVDWMTLIRRQKAVIGALVLYWPTLFVLAHIPVPQVVRAARVSDKSLHLLAYMILTFLLWSAIRPLEKVRWRKAGVWWILAVVLVYGVCDECLQNFVASRTMDPMDYLADVAGTVTALALLTVVSFWPASMLIAGATIYTLAVVTRSDLTALLPVTMILFHLTTHAVFTLLWMGCLRQWLNPKRDTRLWLVASISLPLLLVLVTSVSATISGKVFEPSDVISAVAGVLAAVLIVSAAGALTRRRLTLPTCL